MGNLIWVLGGGAVLAVTVVVYLLMRLGGGTRGEDFLHFRCPGCKRRLRFRASQSGHAGQCSHCGGKLVFPPASQAID